MLWQYSLELETMLGICLILSKNHYCQSENVSADISILSETAR